MSVECNWPRIYTLSRYLYAILGTLELIFLVALSVVGEREFICEIIWKNKYLFLFLKVYHVIFFYAFGGFATGFFITNAVCHSQSLYYLNPYVKENNNYFINNHFKGRISYYFKIVVTILYIISIPILFGAFILYWKKCITISKKEENIFNWHINFQCTMCSPSPNTLMCSSQLPTIVVLFGIFDTKLCSA